MKELENKKIKNIKMTEKNTKSKTIQTFVDTLKNVIITMYMPNNKLNQFTKSITETFSNT